MTSYVLPNPFPISSNFGSFQKGTGVNQDDAPGCVYYNATQDQAYDREKLKSLFIKLDDQTVWTCQVAMVSDCDECVYGPVSATLRHLIADLRGLCCLSDACLVGVCKAILCNPILNYRGRYERSLASYRAIELKNRTLFRQYAMIRAATEAKRQEKCATLAAIRTAIKEVKKTNVPEAQSIACCLAECARELCEETAGAAQGEIAGYENCPCQPVAHETLERASVVIKVYCPAPESAGAGETCDDTLVCTDCDPYAGAQVDFDAESNVNGLAYKNYCELPVNAEWEPYYPNDCKESGITVVLTFRCGRAMVTSEGVVTGDNYYTSFTPYDQYPTADCNLGVLNGVTGPVL